MSPALATTTTTSWNSKSSTAITVGSTQQKSSAAPAADIELHLLQAFGEFASGKVLSSYLSVKHSSRILGFLADTTEKVVTKTGVVAVVSFLFAQFQRVGHPLVQYVDEAMGKRIITAFVNVLLLAKQQQENEQNEVLLLENGNSNQSLKLTYEERVHALLEGEVPRLQTMLLEIQQREAEALEKAANAPPAVVMDLEDFVSKEEVKRLQDENRAMLSDKEQELVVLKEQLNDVERARQQLEQDLTDVHNYQESERGQRFKEMEEELAMSKLEAIQKAHDLRKLELVVEALRRKRQPKGKSNRSNATPSQAGSDIAEDVDL